MEKENEISEEKEIKTENELDKLNEQEIENKEDNICNEEKTKPEVETKVEVIKEEKIEMKEENLKEEKQLENKEETKEKNKKNKKNLLIILAIIAVILLFLSTIFAITNMDNNNIVKGVYIEKIDISNLTKEEVDNLINEKISNIENVEVYFGDYKEIIKLEDLGIEISAKDAIQEATSIGKSNNIIVDNFKILRAKLLKTKLEINITINEENFEKIIQNIQAELPDGIKQYSYEIKDKELLITKGKEGKTVIKDELKNRITENIKNQFNGISNPATEIPTKVSQPDKIDIEKIYNEIYKEAKDAYIIDDDETFELHKEEDGIDLGITIEKAKQILSEEKATYTIPLKITKPKVAVKDLGDKLFKQTLAKYTTIYDAGNRNRSHNVALAAKTINGTILLPGETFSYNRVLGNTNKEKGYKVGTAYVGGKVVESYGGGICQVSSTLYNVALYANLEIVERYNHSYIVNYVPAGRDATVAYGGKDFKFKNTRTYPIKIVSSAKNGVVSISIMGIKEEKEYEVVLTSSVLSTTLNSTKYENNSSLPEGTEKVIQKGYIGKTSIAYKILKYNGKTISKTVLSKDTYKPMNKIVQIGTKKTEQTTTVNPTTDTTTQVNTQPVHPPVDTIVQTTPDSRQVAVPAT